MNFQYENNTNQYSPAQFSIMPPVCKNLLIINVICYLATIVLRSRGINLTELFGLHFFAASHHHIWQWVTYSFFHGSFSHLFFNMFAIWMFGYTLENVWGSKRFILYCLVSALGAALMQEITYYFMYKDLLSGVYTNVKIGYDRVPVEDYLNSINTIGASGIVFGLLAAFGLMFPNTTVYFYFLLPIKTKWFVLGYIALELLNGVLGTPDGVAHFAHLGGALAGFILLFIWKKQRDKYRY
ncbi:MAG: rhomboid family intramembrane serine protease [Candidatus Onthomorpha sp.]|nr:rhomboid family intramembrane serine protease [Candidatus Onthomorpha sp.]